jgi:hypothetical protein
MPQEPQNLISFVRFASSIFIGIQQIELPSIEEGVEGLSRLNLRRTALREPSF